MMRCNIAGRTWHKARLKSTDGTLTAEEPSGAKHTSESYTHDQDNQMRHTH